MSAKAMQQINLYKAEFKPKLIVLTAKEMAFITLAVILIMFVASLVSSSQVDDHEILLQQSKLAYESNQQRLETLKQSVQSYTAQTGDINQLELLKNKLFEKQAMLNQLQKESLSQSSGFSIVLSSLSEQHLSQIWLKEFSILRGGEAITIHGRSTQAKFIPEYIDNLSQSENFKGKQFSIFEMHQPDSVSNSYDFKLTSRPKSGEQK